MPRLFIANCTRQRQEVFYRLDFSSDGIRLERQAPKKIVIESGRQTSLDLKHISQSNAIIDQLAKVGGRRVEEQGRLPKKVIPYLLAQDKTVPIKLIEQVHAHNMGVLNETSEVRRKHAAIAGSEVVQQAVAAANGTINKFQAEVVQDTSDGAEMPRDAKPVDIGMEVDVGSKGGGKGGRGGGKGGGGSKANLS